MRSMDETLVGVQYRATIRDGARIAAENQQEKLYEAVCACYAARNATLQELAKATGLSKQRIHQIVGEGETS